MQFYLYTITGSVIVIVLIGIFWLTLFQSRRSRTIKIHDASLTCEELEKHARETAVEHVVSRKPNLSNWPMPRMNENYNYILSVYKELNDDVQKKRTLPPAAEWLLDNFYIIEEQVKSIRRDLTLKDYSRLPVVKCGTFRGHARAYAIARELVSHTNGQIDERLLLNYLKAYQTHTILTDREIWSMSNMIRLALIENIKYVCEKVKETQQHWRKADDLVDVLLNDEGQDTVKLIRSFENKIKELYEVNPSFIEHLSYRLRRAGRTYAHVLGFVDDILAKHGTNIDEITQKEHNSQAVNTVAMGNCIMSLKFISTLDWTDIFLATSNIEQILRQDPDGTYPLMDQDSRNLYRLKIEELAQKFKVSETHIAKEAIELAKHVCTIDSSNLPHDASARRTCHVGYYLIGNGMNELEKRLNYRPSSSINITDRLKSRPIPLYLGDITVITLILTGVLMAYTYNASARHSLLLTLIAGLAAVIPSADIAICLVNWIMCNIFKPVSFPRLELKDGIPEELSTMIVIPALLPDEKRVKELLENLETHYLANKEENLYFALAGDFKDSPESIMPGDQKIVEAGLSGIKKLNEKYAKTSRGIFYYFHRDRQYNEQQKKWMGWERKRGALIEFNDLLLGARNTSYTVLSSASLPANIQYVITLDADTVLPIGEAKKMIGTMAHPLNRPVVDERKGIVIDGYGLIQPKIIFDVESSNKTLFSRIFTGQEGIDPYASAISDVYQDLFREGIFTGKGIYDLHVFQKVLKTAIPENTVLSHDLLEGCYVRTGLVTDLELIDSYPTRYNSYSARLHRWVRGDWQLLPWLGSTVINKDGRRVKNPLSLISRWKIFDNLRRSLVAPCSMLLIGLGFSILPGSGFFWLAFIVVVLGFCLITSIIDTMLSRQHSTRKLKRHVPVISGLKATLLQIVLLFVFLPYQAYLMVSAISITLTRLLFTKRNMLEWVTAADVEKGQKNSLAGFWAKMRISALEAMLLVLLTLIFKPSSAFLSIPVSILWISSPVVAYRISKIQEDTPARLSPEDLKELRLIARKTWRYFEEFMNMRNHYLAPDNYQEDPPNDVAYRTSPTNIGLGLLAQLAARDLGYIGTSGMIDTISNTMATLEKMEKWNGHLYNWYDTRTLRPLRPRYVSTVDSGNLVCYLVTLIQGLTEYLNKPLVETVFVDGFMDTTALMERENNPALSAARLLHTLAENKIINLQLWSKALEELEDSLKDPAVKKTRWKAKSEHMVESFKKELSMYMPWIPLIKDMPETLKENTDRTLQDLLNALNGNPAVKDFPILYREVLKNIDSTMESLKSSNQWESEILWLAQLRDTIVPALENVENLVDRYNQLIDRIRSFSDNISFLPLYVEKKQLFSIGFNIEENRLTNSYYDLLASEARQTSFIAIARGEVPPRHWFKLGRTLTVVDYYKGLVSWTGTMFEYLMPLLIMKSYRNTLMDETYSFVVRSQKKYGKQRNIPWGSSESGFYSLDINLDYQYKAIGVPWLGLKRGLIEDAVVAPYATFLALPLDPAGAMENIKRLKAEGMDGPYGYYEAVDYTPERLPFGSKRGIVKSFMAHHEGMTLMALNNYLNDNILQRRFHSDPVVRAAQLLLQEKVPPSVVFTKETKEKVFPFKDVVFKEKTARRKFTQPDPVLPKAHILSNGNYSVMITDRGTGYSKNKAVAITRWREDVTLDRFGMFFFIRNTESNQIWSAAYKPIDLPPQKYEVSFSSDKARFKRTDGNIETVTEVIVASVDNVEIRRISLKNRGENPCILEVTSYFEVVLAPHGADIAHPAFSNLFVRTEFLPEANALIANRRPRSEAEKEKWMTHKAIVEGELVGNIQYETDRMQFIGRGHSVSNAVVFEGNKPLSNTTGPVLDPIMSLRLRVRIEPGQTAAVNYMVAVSETQEALLEILEKYSTPESIEEAFRLALTRSQVEARYLNIKTSDLELYQDIISHILFISPLRRLMQETIAQNRKGQSGLWSYGISGDIPIVLVVLKKSDEIDIVYEALKAHEYWRLKDLKVDLVILNEEENSYTHPLCSLLADIVSASHAHDILNKPGGVFLLSTNTIPEEDIPLFFAVARIILRGNAGSLSQQIQAMPRYQLPELKSLVKDRKTYPPPAARPLELRYHNGLGGFSPDGREYVLRLEKGQNTPLPWVNVIANPSFGFLVTESGSGYTWSENSRENKLTPWSNDPVSDTPGEVLYVSDSDTGDVWSITPLPVREEGTYTTIHGFGYSRFEHTSHGVEQSMVLFVPPSEPVKISIVQLKNITDERRNLTATYYIRPVLGVIDDITALHLTTSVNENGTLLIQNPYNEEFAGRIAFIDSSEKERWVTGDRKEFFGSGSLSDPEGLKRQRLSGTVGLGYDPCGAMQVSVSLEPGQQKELVFLLGNAKESQEVVHISQKYKHPQMAGQALQYTRGYWLQKLGSVQVNTPDMSMNYMLNGWLMYQTVSCRIWARSAFYQSGGAFGFRDQLQDSLSVAHVWPELTYNQILLHARHQFLEGDVQHWWHEPKSKGTRTRFSDDLLWLPYVTAEYIRITGDSEILQKRMSFLVDEPLREFEDERYSIPRVSTEEATLYEHCIRAIDRASKFGEHGIPLMGSGDWNDGMNTVGNRGKGESVWLGWFLYSTLVKFTPICRSMGDMEKAEKYTDTAASIINSIEKNAWDGNWYRRAYFDNGIPLGSVQNSECKIDSISQSWSVISGAGDEHRSREAMSSVENYLVQRDDGLIKLLTPPFDAGDLEPGYIKGYVPGVRENGGQYTHAAAWVIIAFAKLGEGDKAWELFELINPINHTRTHMEYSKYKAEPYVMAADVYAAPPHVGRGGWTWYTGSSGWIYRAGLEYILGFQKNGDKLVIDPCIPHKWSSYSIKYKYLDTDYGIEVKNPEGVCKGVKSVNVDGNLFEGNVIALVNDGKVHRVEVNMGI